MRSPTRRKAPPSAAPREFPSTVRHQHPDPCDIRPIGKHRPALHRESFPAPCDINTPTHATSDPSESTAQRCTARVSQHRATSTPRPMRHPTRRKAPPSAAPREFPSTVRHQHPDPCDMRSPTRRKAPPSAAPREFPSTVRHQHPDPCDMRSPTRRKAPPSAAPREFPSTVRHQHPDPCDIRPVGKHRPALHRESFPAPCDINTPTRATSDPSESTALRCTARVSQHRATSTP